MDENDLTINLETKDGETVRARIIMAFADKSRNYIALCYFPINIRFKLRRKRVEHSRFSACFHRVNQEKVLMPETGNDENTGTDERDILLYRYREIKTDAGNGNTAKTGGTSTTGTIVDFLYLVPIFLTPNGRWHEKVKVYKTGVSENAGGTFENKAASEDGDEMTTIELTEIKRPSPNGREKNGTICSFCHLANMPPHSSDMEFQSALSKFEEMVKAK